MGWRCQQFLGTSSALGFLELRLEEGSDVFWVAIVGPVSVEWSAFHRTRSSMERCILKSHILTHAEMCTGSIEATSSESSWFEGEPPPTARRAILAQIPSMAHGPRANLPGLSQPSRVWGDELLKRKGRLGPPCSNRLNTSNNLVLGSLSGPRVWC